MKIDREGEKAPPHTGPLSTEGAGPVGVLTRGEGSVERPDDSELREEEEQGEDGSDFT